MKIYFLDGLVLPESNWIGERNGLPNDKENEITSDINAPLDSYLNDLDAEAGVDSDEKMEKIGGRPKRFTTEFNGMQGKRIIFTSNSNTNFPLIPFYSYKYLMLQNIINFSFISAILATQGPAREGNKAEGYD